MKTIYLDNASTTAVNSEVLKEMLPYFTEDYGNASSGTHKLGWKSKAAVTKSRKIIANHIGAEEGELIFTSGATESINLGLKGVFDLYKTKGKHIISCKTEHKACLDTLNYLEENGAEISYVHVDKNGLINFSELEKLIRPDTILLTFMWVNNETGTIQNVAKIGEIAKKNKLLFFCDGTQALGKFKINVKENGIAMLAISAHKTHGPKGIGALFISRKNPRVTLTPLIHGGNQEKNLRSGTLNTPAIVGFGKAIECIDEDFSNAKVIALAQKIKNHISNLGGKLNIDSKYACPHILNFQVPKTKATNLIKLNPQFAFSLGSACTSEKIETSHVLKAIGLNKKEVEHSFRISIGTNTTLEEIEEFETHFKV